MCLTLLVLNREGQRLQQLRAVESPRAKPDGGHLDAVGEGEGSADVPTFASLI